MTEEEKNIRKLRWRSSDMIKHIESRFDRIEDFHPNNKELEEKFDKLKCLEEENSDFNYWKNKVDGLEQFDYFDVTKARQWVDNYFNHIKMILNYKKIFKEDLPDTFKKEYPEKGVDPNSYYYDQSAKYGNFLGRSFFSAYTSHGIQLIDKFYADEIMNPVSIFTKKELTKAIKKNPHLHNVIKTNLLSNLNTRD